MLAATPDPKISLIGILVELGACLLLTTLVLGLRRETAPRRYFILWSWAWVALSFALVTIGLRYNLIPVVAPAAVAPLSGVLLGPFYAMYQSARFLFVGFLLLGVLAYIGRTFDLHRARMVVVGAAIALGAIPVLFTVDLNALLVVQAAVAAPAFALSAWWVRGQPSNRSLGTQILQLALVGLAVQWGLYLLAFAEAGGPVSTPWQFLLNRIAAYNSYLDAGQIIILGVGMALTLVEDDRRDAERAQQSRIVAATAAEARLAEVLRAAHEGIVTLDADHRIGLINRAAETALGLVDESQGESFDRFLRPDQRESLWTALAATTRRSEANPPVALRRDVIGLRANGDEFPLELSVSSFGEGSARGFVLVLRDLTDQLRSRGEQEQLQAQLAHAARLEAVGRMVSGVAHELNNPLTAIMAFGQDLLGTSRNEEDQEALTVIVQQAERCRVIVGDLLIFARSRREERRRTTADDLVRRVTRVFERDSAHQNVSFVVNIAADLPPLDADGPGIEQVLTNLLTNAFQAVSTGGSVTLTVAVRDDRLVFQIDDEGTGIAPEAMPRLFEPFFTTKTLGEGTGLGLSVSHAIVHQHGGAIVAENLPGRGARFTVALPFVERRLDDVLPRSDRFDSVAGAGGDGSSIGLALVVDDEPAIRVAVRRSLERHGWQVDEAADGHEAWLRLDVGGRPGPYHVVVTDLRMPGLSGIELVDRLRATHPALADRTIVITGDTASPSVAEFLARLTTPYLQKPFDMRTLVHTVARFRARETV